MTITQLEYVVAVATYKSFVTAAEKSFVTQPTLSMQIHKLEQELSVRIFDRSKHPIMSTEVGKGIVSQAKIILAESAKIQEIVESNLGRMAGVFRLAIIPTLAPYILPHFLESHARIHPDLRLVVSEMQTQEIVQALKDAELDAALVSTPLDDQRIKEHPLFYEPLVAYFGKDETIPLSKRMITAEDIDLERIWMLNEGNCLRNQVINLCSKRVEEIQSDRPYNYTSGNVETLRRMVDANGGLTIIPELATFEFREDQMENVRYFREEQPVREISLITNDHFARISVLESLMQQISNTVPESMRVKKKDRKLMRIQAI